MALIYKNEAVIFDLDDLLFKEFDFVRSAFWSIAKMISPEKSKVLFRSMMVQYFSGNAVFDWLYNDHLKQDSDFTVSALLEIYRNHKPDITLSADVFNFLSKLKNNGNMIGLITDGRSISQRNKIEALGLLNWIDGFTISEDIGFEKPSQEPYRYFMEKFKAQNYVYIADNYNKDFIAPNQLGWRTIALSDNGLNVHSKKENLDSLTFPQEVVESFKELEISEESMSDVVNKLGR